MNFICNKLQPILDENKSIRACSIFITEVVFRMGPIDLDIKISLWRTCQDNKVFFTQSHYINTPIQTDKYIASSSIEENEENALEKAIGTITGHYNEARKAGHFPKTYWFHENVSYPYF